MVGFEPEALGLGFGDALVEILQFLDRDVLPLLEADRLGALLVLLQRLLGFLEPDLEPLRLLNEEFTRDLRRIGAGLHVLADEFLYDGARDRLGHGGLLVLGGDLDQARAAADARRDPAGQLRACLGQVVFLRHAVEQRQAHEVLLDRFDDLVALQLFLVDLLDGDHLLGRLLDLDDLARGEDARAAADLRAAEHAGEDEAEDDQPGFGEEDVNDLLEVDAVRGGGVGGGFFMG